MAIEIVDFPMKHGGSFHRFLYVYPAGYPKRSWKISSGAIELPSRFWCHMNRPKRWRHQYLERFSRRRAAVWGGLSRPNFFWPSGSDVQYIKWQCHGQNMKVTWPGNDCYIANWKMAIEIVDLPIENGDLP